MQLAERSPLKGYKKKLQKSFALCANMISAEFSCCFPPDLFLFGDQILGANTHAKKAA